MINDPIEIPASAAPLLARRGCGRGGEGVMVMVVVVWSVPGTNGLAFLRATKVDWPPGGEVPVNSSHFLLFI